MSEIKDRIVKFLDYKGLGQLNFETQCGLARGFVSKVGFNISEKSLNKIKVAFPELNSDWLRFGQGSMLTDGTEISQLKGVLPEETATMVYLLPVAAQGGSLNDFVVSVKNGECEKVVSPIKNADFAMPVAGDSMAPEYPNGSQIFIKKINEKAFIEWGKVYVLDTCNGSVIKILTPGSDKDHVKCLSINQDPIFAPFEVHWADVYGVYRVLMCMAVK